MVTVTIADSGSLELQRMLTASGVQVTSIDMGRLQVLTQAEAAQPDVLVVDVRTMTGIPPVVSALHQQHPGTGIVLVLASLDPSLLLEGMRAGANEVVAEPLRAGDLERAVAQVARRRLMTAPGRVFAFIGAKGGIGTTTVAANVAASLADLGKPARTLLMDLHPIGGGDAALFFDVAPLHSVAEAIENIDRVDQSYFRGLVVQAAPNLDLLAASERFPGASFDKTRLRALLDFAAATYKYTVLDLARSDVTTLEALERVDLIVVLVTRDMQSAKAGAKYVALLRERYGSERVVVVANRSDRHADFTEADIARVVDADLVHSFPSDYRTALHAVHTGRPLVLNGRGALADSIKRFTGWLAGVQPEGAGRRFGAAVSRSAAAVV
jgi:pilus assembly protein CpaE